MNTIFPIKYRCEVSNRARRTSAPLTVNTASPSPLLAASRPCAVIRKRTPSQLGLRVFYYRRLLTLQDTRSYCTVLVHVVFSERGPAQSSLTSFSWSLVHRPRPSDGHGADVSSSGPPANALQMPFIVPYSLSDSPSDSTDDPVRVSPSVSPPSLGPEPTREPVPDAIADRTRSALSTISLALCRTHSEPFSMLLTK